MVSFAALDWIVLGGFVALLLGIGMLTRAKDGTVLGYLSAGRGLSLPAFVATLVSTWYGGILGVGESVSYYGYGTLVLMGVPYYVFGFIYAVFLSKRVRAADQISIPERFAAVYGPRAGVLGGVLMFLLSVPAAHVLMLGVLIQVIFGWSLLVCVTVSAVLGLALLMRGGLLADVRIAVPAFLMMYIGFAALVGSNMLQESPLVAWSRLPESSRTWDGGTGWPFVLSFFILGAWTLVDPGFHQRAASARDPGTARTGVLVSVGCWMLFDLLSIGAALYALSRLGQTPPDPMHLYPAASALVPHGVRGLFFCGILGTVVSAYAGYLLVAGGSFGRECIARALKLVDDSQIKRWVQAGTVIAACLAWGLALSVQSVVNLWYSWAGSIVGAMLIPTLMAYRGRSDLRSMERAVVVATTMGFLLALGWMIFGLRTGNPFLSIAHVNGRWMLPGLSGSEPMEATIASSQQISIGTLLPGLVLSSAILWVGARIRQNRDEP